MPIQAYKVDFKKIIRLERNKFISDFSYIQILCAIPLLVKAAQYFKQKGFQTTIIGLTLLMKSRLDSLAMVLVSFVCLPPPPPPTIIQNNEIRGYISFQVIMHESEGNFLWAKNQKGGGRGGGVGRERGREGRGTQTGLPNGDVLSKMIGHPGMEEYEE